jgi:hypothetical protein
MKRLADMALKLTMQTTRSSLKVYLPGIDEKNPRISLSGNKLLSSEWSHSLLP